MPFDMHPLIAIHSAFQPLLGDFWHRLFLVTTVSHIDSGFLNRKTTVLRSNASHWYWKFDWPTKNVVALKMYCEQKKYGLMFHHFNYRNVISYNNK